MRRDTELRVNGISNSTGLGFDAMPKGAERRVDASTGDTELRVDVVTRSDGLEARRRSRGAQSKPVATERRAGRVEAKSSAHSSSAYTDKYESSEPTLFYHPNFAIKLKREMESMAKARRLQNAELLSFLQPLVLPLLKRSREKSQNWTALWSFCKQAENLLFNKIEHLRKNIACVGEGSGVRAQCPSPEEPTVYDMKTTRVVYGALQSALRIPATGQRNSVSYLPVLSKQQSDLKRVHVPEVVRAELSKRLSELTAEIQLYVSESSSHSGTASAESDVTQAASTNASTDATRSRVGLPRQGSDVDDVGSFRVDRHKAATDNSATREVNEPASTWSGATGSADRDASTDVSAEPVLPSHMSDWSECFQRMTQHCDSARCAEFLRQAAHVVLTSLASLTEYECRMLTDFLPRANVYLMQHESLMMLKNAFVMLKQIVSGKVELLKDGGAKQRQHVIMLLRAKVEQIQARKWLDNALFRQIYFAACDLEMQLTNIQCLDRPDRATSSPFNNNQYHHSVGATPASGTAVPELANSALDNEFANVYTHMRYSPFKVQSRGRRSSMS